MDTTTRNTDLAGLAAMLQEQHLRKIDLVVPASQIRSIEGQIHIRGVGPILLDDGVLDGNGYYSPTMVFDEGLADRLGIPLAYVRRLRDSRRDLMDANVNGWLHGHEGGIDGLVAPDSRSFLVRCYRGDDDNPGIARALLSDRFNVIDNFDVLMAVLDAMRSLGVDGQVKADLTDRRMVVRVTVPQIQALAPDLLRGYRSPFTGNSGDDNPTVFAGFQIANSETGGGAFSITPRMVVEVCDNGMTISKDVMRQVHVGGRMDAGVIRWSDETQERNLALIKSKTVDAVRTFLDVDYMKQVIAQASEKADEKVTTPEAVENITRPLGYSKTQIAGIMEHFIQGGQTNRAGVMNAITSFSQTVEDGDVAYDMENSALKVLGI